MEIPQEHRHQILEEETPSWAIAHDLRPVPAVAPEMPTEGARHPALLIDHQHNLETGEFYHRRAYYLTNYAAVAEGSRIEISLAPGREHLVLHSLLIRRGGEIIDLRAGQEVRVLHREAEMERHVFDGRLLAVMLLPDVRAGDVVDYSFSRRSTCPPLFGRLCGGFVLQGNFAAQALRCRILYREDRAVYVAPRFCNVQPQVGYTPEGLVECRWDRDDVKPTLINPGTPGWAVPFQFVDYGEFATWEDVAEAASRLFTFPAESFPGHLDGWLEQVRATAATPEEFILQVIRYVQDRIRYVSVSLEEHTHVPYDVSTILDRHYGDCKDKATLLSQLLRRAGFDAAPALVHAHQRERAVQGLARPTAFNHAIVRLRHNGRTHWIDGTIAGQGGLLETISWPSYGAALVLNSPGEALETIPPPPVPSATSYDEFFKVHQTDGMAELRVTRVYTGMRADTIRHRLAQVGLPEFERQLLANYRRAYPDIKINAPASCDDNRDANRITIIYTFLLLHLWQQVRAAAQLRNQINQAVFHAFGIHPVLQLPPPGKRKDPYATLHPVQINASLKVRLPAGFKPSRQQAIVKSPAFQCKFLKEVSSNSGRLNFQYTSTSDHVVGDTNLQEHTKAIQQLGQFARFTITGRESQISRGFAPRR